jgi:hypothetical protein
MTSQTVILGLSFLLLAAAGFNLLHWWIYGQRFLYWPKGWFGVAVNVLLFGNLITAFLYLTGLVPMIVFWLPMFCHGLIGNLCSIWHRRALNLEAIKAIAA